MSSPLFPQQGKTKYSGGLGEAGDGQLIHPHLELIGRLMGRLAGAPARAAERRGFNLSEHKQILKLGERERSFVSGVQIKLSQRSPADSSHNYLLLSLIFQCFRFHLSLRKQFTSRGLHLLTQRGLIYLILFPRCCLPRKEP